MGPRPALAARAGGVDLRALDFFSYLG